MTAIQWSKFIRPNPVLDTHHTMLCQLRHLARPAARSFSADATRARVFAAALAHVPAHGWSDAALAAGAADCSLPPLAAAGLAPRGAAELVEHAVAEANGARSRSRRRAGETSREPPQRSL